MLLSFLERRGELAELSAEQLDFLHEQFVLYLVHATSFNAVLRACKDALDDDQVHLEPVIRQLLADMIEDYDCNAVYKPAILRLAMGDKTGFKRTSCPTRRTQKIIDRNKKAFKRQVKQIKFDKIGPTHLKSIEEYYLDQVHSHTYWFVQKKAVFLTIAEPGKTVKDLVTDLKLRALVALRRFYPFRDGLHLVNTLKTTVTNRGRSLITYSTADVRRRLIQTETGEHYSVESHNENYENMGSYDPRQSSDVRVTLDWIRKRHPEYAEVVSFVTEADMQDRMLSWYAKTRDVRVASQADLIKHLGKNNERYHEVVAEFLKQPRGTVRKALKHMARGVA